MVSLSPFPAGLGYLCFLVVVIPWKGGVGKNFVNDEYLCIPDFGVNGLLITLQLD